MKETLLSIISLIVGAVVGYWSHILKQNRDFTRQADIKTLEKIKDEYPINSCFLNPNPQMQLSSREKISDKELNKLIIYRDNSMVDMEFYFHNSKINKSYIELRSVLGSFCELVIENMDHAEGCYDNIYALRGRSSNDSFEKNNFEGLVKEIDHLGEKAIQAYLKFIVTANRELKISSI